MFFNQDILFKNGPLSLIWMAGNDELRFKDNRGRRNRQYLLILDSNIVQLCDLVRQQFPQMGTVKGMNLKKIATLIKGLGVIYFSKMDNLARNMSEMHIRLQVSTTARLREIDMPMPTTAKATTATLVANEEMAPLMGFGALEDVQDFDFGVVRFEADIFSSPRDNPRMADDFPALMVTPPRRDENVDKDRGKKKKKGKSGGSDELNEETVMKMLQDTVAQNSMAHCLPDRDVIGPGVPENNGQFDDFNLEFDDPLVHSMHAETHITNQPIEMIDPAHRMSSPPGRLSISGENSRKRSFRPDAEETDDEELQNNVIVPQEPGPEGELLLHSLENEVCRIPHRGRRRSKRLQIDQETAVPLTQMCDELRRHRQPLDYDALSLVMAENQALTHKETQRSLKGIHYIGTIGRKIIGRGLSEFVGSQLEGLRKMPRLDNPIQPVRREEIGSVNELSGEALQQDEISGPQVPIAEVAINDQLHHESGREISDPLQQPADIDLQQNEQEPLIFPLFEEPDDFLVNPVDVQYNNQSDPVPTSQDVIPSGRTTFRTMFAPGSVSRRQAAVGFFHLLRLQAKKRIELQQEAPYGDIIITPTPRPTRME